MSYLFNPPPTVSLPIHGSATRFPVGRVFCLGRNYPWPESFGPAPSEPMFFMKPACNIVQATGELPFPPQTDEFCHEIELVVAIGEGGADIASEQALAHVYGFAAGLDLTRRDRQRQAKAEGLPWEGAKVFEASAPMTAIVPASQCTWPLDASLWLQVNGQERQRAHLSQQTWPLAEVISRLSRLLPLRPGDLIMTGSPPGVAPLNPGDVIHAGIDGIGELHLQVGARASVSRTHAA
ncbi:MULTISPECIES: fumarylacetoacetate hydrolase family protein [unclassified Pseudomonas]|uniref:fumarylacetoacetate hydrolase family protein n=1 Tax=unclassified Pseudomonas TaxID=196821 RepID=UPI0021BAF3A3|nr:MULTISPECIES: fumarylacetoacetate hydrolase family protein [unclassified Pseudomonas]MCT8166711.1 fumarylacetoacetate hydrolase family protein [Pseudomonas sp. HD6422]MCT8185598.1 fumarylacetoacetate hydrolase family protein [Pseudomonas sp. HD6421]